MSAQTIFNNGKNMFISSGEGGTVRFNGIDAPATITAENSSILALNRAASGAVEQRAMLQQQIQSLLTTIANITAENALLDDQIHV